MEEFARLPPERAQELQRLCGLYDEAKAAGNVELCRQIRASISDYIEASTEDDSELEADLRRALAFPTEPTPTVLDQ